MVRAPCFDKNGLKRGAWSEDEDTKLRAYIQRHGHSNWRQLPKLAGLSRCGKSCRLRWMNYLRPNLKRGKFSKEEEEVIIGLYNSLGSKWSVMAKRLPGRSDNEIKNHWHAHLKTRVVRKDQTLFKKDVEMKSVEPVVDNGNPKECGVEEHNLKAQPDQVETLLAMLSSELPSSHSPTCSLSVSDYAVPSDVSQQFSESEGNFWTDPFLLTNDNVMSSSDDFFADLGLADDDLLGFI